jgi:large subunit ribosomal protein L19
MKAIKELEDEYTKKKLPEIAPGDTVRVHQKIKEKDKTRIQIFEGLVISRHGGQGLSGSFTVRKIAADGIGVERTFPLHSPLLSKIQIIKKGKVRRAKLFYVRRKQLKSLKLKERKEYQGLTSWEEEKKKEEKTVEKEEENKEDVNKEKEKEEKTEIKDKSQEELKPKTKEKAKDDKNDKKDDKKKEVEQSKR